MDCLFARRALEAAVSLGLGISDARIVDAEILNALDLAFEHRGCCGDAAVLCLWAAIKVSR